MLFEKVHLESNEKVLRVVRKHWFIIISELFGVAAMALFPFLILFTFTFLPESLKFFDLGTENVLQIITFSISAWLLLSLFALIRVLGLFRSGRGLLLLLLRLEFLRSTLRIFRFACVLLGCAFDSAGILQLWISFESQDMSVTVLFVKRLDSFVYIDEIVDCVS